MAVKNSAKRITMPILTLIIPKEYKRAHTAITSNIPETPPMIFNHKGLFFLFIFFNIPFKIVYSHAIQVHCSNAIIIGFVTTVFTGKQMQFLIPVRLFNVTTDRTALNYIHQKGYYLQHRKLQGYVKNIYRAITRYPNLPS